jgi:hypothetical protein
MGIDETGMAEHDVDVISLKLRSYNFDLRLHDAVTAEGQIGHLDVGFNAIPRAVNISLAVAGKINDGFFDTGNGTCVDANTAHYFAHVDYADPFPDFCRLHGGALARGTAAYDQKIIVKTVGSSW